MIHDVGITIIIHLGMVYTIIIYGDLGDGLHVYTYIYIYGWLVVWNMDFIFPCIWNSLFPIEYFSEGLKPATRNSLLELAMQ